MDTARAIERFLNSPALGEGTRRSYRHDVEEFAGWLADRRLDLRDVDIRVFADYATDLGRARPRKLAPATIARKIAAVRSFLRFTLGAEERAGRVAVAAPSAQAAGHAEAGRGRGRARGARRRRAAGAAKRRADGARLLRRPAERGGGRARPRGRGLRPRAAARQGQGRQGATRPARRGGGPCPGALPP